ncbi:MAG: hydrogenase maturation protease [Candidatus Omnitrophica bacterium]|nr:hydrogenase maturation protease [Candidatus Omnitrophota bacterium]
MKTNCKNSTLEHLRLHLTGKVVILGIGNTLRRDDGIGSLLAQMIHTKVPYLVYDAASSPENYLGKIIKDKPDNIIIIDAVDYGAKPGGFSLLEAEDVETTNLFATHNASISLTINYLKNNLKVDIIILVIQPKSIAFGEGLSRELEETLNTLGEWFCESGKEKG